MAFRLSDNRCEEIKEIVVNTFEELDIRCIPISGFEIATKLGAIVVPYSSKSVETHHIMLEETMDGFNYQERWRVVYFLITMQKATDMYQQHSLLTNVDI